MDVTVAIPWRAQPGRVYAHKTVRDWYAQHFPRWRVIDVDAGGKPFCLAACRNLGVTAVPSSDVVILNDADTLPEPGALGSAVMMAAALDAMLLPYDEYRSLRRDGTEQYLTGTPLPDCDHMVVDGATSGVYVTTPAAWWAAGGQDERFLGWGFEDAAWRAAADTLTAVHTIPGRVYSMHHPSQTKRGRQYRTSGALMVRYLQAQHSPDAMRALVNEPKRFNLTGGPR